MNRISIQTSTIDGKRHVTAYLSDGITITERAGTSVIKTMIRTYLAHRWAQYKIRKQITTPKTNSTNFKINTSARVIRFQSRVDRMERTVTHGIN